MLFYKTKNRTRLVAIVFFDVVLLFYWAAYFLIYKSERSGLALLVTLFVTFLYVGVMRPRRLLAVSSG